MFANQQVLTALEQHANSTSAALNQLGKNDVALGKKLDAILAAVNSLTAAVAKLGAGSITASEAAVLTAELKDSESKLQAAIAAAPHPS